MKNYFTKLGTYLLDFAASLGIGLLVETFAPLPIRLAADDLSTLAYRIIQAVFFVITTSLWLFFSARTISYKSREFHLNTVLISALSVFVIQQALAPLFHYAEYVSGGALPLTYAIFLKNGAIFAEAPTFKVAGVPQWGYHVIMLVLALVCYLPAIIFGEYSGAKKRAKERDQLINGHSN